MHVLAKLDFAQHHILGLIEYTWEHWAHLSIKTSRLTLIPPALGLCNFKSIEILKYLQFINSSALPKIRQAASLTIEICLGKPSSSRLASQGFPFEWHENCT